MSLDGFLRSLPSEASDPQKARLMVQGLRQILEAEEQLQTVGVLAPATSVGGV